jgi:hypothetical protein
MRRAKAVKASLSAVKQRGAQARAWMRFVGHSFGSPPHGIGLSQPSLCCFDYVTSCNQSTSRKKKRHHAINIEIYQVTYSNFMAFCGTPFVIYSTPYLTDQRVQRFQNCLKLWQILRWQLSPVVDSSGNSSCLCEGLSPSYDSSMPECIIQSKRKGSTTPCPWKENLSLPAIKSQTIIRSTIRASEALHFPHLHSYTKHRVGDDRRIATQKRHAHRHTIINCTRNTRSHRLAAHWFVPHGRYARVRRVKVGGSLLRLSLDPQVHGICSVSAGGAAPHPPCPLPAIYAARGHSLHASRAGRSRLPLLCFHCHRATIAAVFAAGRRLH